MADEFPNRRDELLPGPQRIAWMAAIWFIGAGAIVALSLAIRALLA